MFWRSKARLQMLFSRVPGGERLNFLAQKYVTRSMRLTERDLLGVAQHTREYLRILAAHGKDLNQTTAFEFGAGWFLAKQLLLSLSGCRDQITVDLRPLATVKLINQALATLAGCSDSLGTLTRPIRPIRSFEDLRTFYGIRYLAPFDARETGLPEGTADLVSSTATLEHIPPSEIRAILRESRRILKPDGLAIHYVDYTDHFAHTDPSISVYNFLQFSEDEWKRYNSFIHYQNRLRHDEYLKLFSEEGFEVLEQRHDRAKLADLQRLQELKLSPEFRTYSLEQVSIQGATFVLGRRTTRPRLVASAN